jgi:predicted ferric reductase
LKIFSSCLLPESVQGYRTTNYLDNLITSWRSPDMATTRSAPLQAGKMHAVFDEINQHLGHDLLWALMATIGAVFVFRCTQSYHRRVRLVACMHSDTQRFFSKPSEWWSYAKYYLLYAPLLQARHNSSWLLGQLPTRLQALFLIAVMAANAFLCFYDVPYRDLDAEVLGILRARTGTVAVTHLIPIMIMVSVRNPLIKVLNISYDSFNLMHRWFGRIAIIEASLHTTCHISSVVQRGGWSSFTKTTSEPIIWTGLVAMSAFLAILMHSPSILRRAFYEIFLHIHITLAILALLFLWMHLEPFPQRHLLLAAMIIWAASRLLRLSTLLYRSTGPKPCTATLEACPGDTVRITITPSRPWTYQPGQYLYLTVPSIGLWTAHPFSIAWSDSPEPTLTRQRSIDFQNSHDAEKLAIGAPQTFSLLVRARDGFTKRLLAHTLKHTPAHLGHRVPVKVLVEGPYGLSRSLDSYGTVLLIAGGVGITHHLGYVRHLLRGYAEGRPSRCGRSHSSGS